MAKGFTDIAIRALKARASRYEIPDPGARGLYLVVQPSGRKSFAVRYRHGKKTRKLTLKAGISLGAARKLASDALYAVEQGADPAETKKATRAKIEEARADTMQALCENYMRREASKLRTARQRARVLERLVYPNIGALPLADLKRSTIIKMLDKIEDENGQKMSDLVLAYIRKILNWHEARADDFVSPIRRNMSRYDACANQGTRTLDDRELAAIWRATDKPQPFHALIRFLLLTGARRSEAMDLPWSEVVDGIWTLPSARNKTKVDLVRPLSAAALAVLKTMPATHALVFTHDGRRMSLSRPTAQLKVASGTDGWRVHDIRRTTRTLLSRAGVDSDVAERCLGHSIRGVRAIYDRHNFQEEMRQAFERLSTLIDNIINPDERVIPLSRSR